MQSRKQLKPVALQSCKRRDLKPVLLLAANPLRRHQPCLPQQAQMT